MPAKKKTSSKTKVVQEMQIQELPFEYDPEAPTIFTDSIRIAMSLYGVACVMTQVELGPGMKPRARHVGTVHLSPQHAKALATALAERVAEYERLNGPLPTNPEA